MSPKIFTKLGYAMRFQEAEEVITDYKKNEKLKTCHPLGLKNH